MPDLANLDQALMMIMAEVYDTPLLCDNFMTKREEVLEAMRRAYRLGMSAEGLARQFIEGGK